MKIGDGCYVEHNTVIDCSSDGLDIDRGGDLGVTVSNNLVDNCTDDYDIGGSGGTLTTKTNYSSDATSPDGASYQSKTFAFENEGADDFHLDSSEDGNYEGTDVSARFSDDIDGETRSD